MKAVETAVEIEIKDKKTLEYLKPIFNRTSLIANPTMLNIPGEGKGTATSMVHYRVNHKKIESYFSFTTGEENLEFRRRENKYYKETQN